MTVTWCAIIFISLLLSLAHTISLTHTLSYPHSLAQSLSHSLMRVVPASLSLSLSFFTRTRTLTYTNRLVSKMLTGHVTLIKRLEQAIFQLSQGRVKPSTYSHQLLNDS